VIPLVNLKLQHQSIRAELDAALARVLDSCQFALGSEVAAFEEEFAAFCSARHGVGVNSGTSALHLALLAAGVGPGDEVITVPFTFVATVAAIGYAGARARLVDIDPRSYTMNPARIEAAITPRTKAIIPVHLYGQPADMDPILAIARKRGLAVIEDAAQAHGAEYKGRRCGSLGDLACFSFYPSKNLGACGEAGMVTTGNPEFLRTLRMLRDWGQEAKYQHVLKGFNYRMEGFQGAVLRVKLRHLPRWTEARRARAAQYGKLLAGSGIEPPAEMPYTRHVYYVYSVRAQRRDPLKEALHKDGVDSGIHYPAPVHLLKAYADLGYKEGDFPEAERAAREILSLPMFAELTEDQVRTVCDAVRKESGKK
jgi:dTDP-4-amino-4,6-dideoxygalactose transaminase